MYLIVTNSVMLTFIAKCLLFEFCTSETSVIDKMQIFKHRPPLGMTPEDLMSTSETSVIDEKYKIFEYSAPLGMTPEDLMTCFKERHGFDPYIDSEESKIGTGYIPEDLGEWFLHQQIKDSTYTTTVEGAEFFFVNTMPILSFHTGGCNGMSHKERQSKWLDIIENSESFQKRPQDHAFICQSWSCFRVVSPSLFSLARQMTYLIHEANSFWVSGWNSLDPPPSKKIPEHAIMVPYVANSHITTNSYKSWNERSINVAFLGSLSRRSAWRDVLQRPEVQNISTLYLQDISIDNHVNNETAFDTYSEIMEKSKFCLVIRGDTPSSRRLFDAMIAGCIPVFAGPKYLMPFENLIPYDKFSIRFDTDSWFENTIGSIKSLNEISEVKALQMQNEMRKYANYVDWRHGNQVLQAILINMHLKRMNLVKPVEWHSYRK